MPKFERNSANTWWMLKSYMVRGVKAADRLSTAMKLLLGVALCLFGLLGFLPILGFWMLPLGLVIIGLCAPFARKRITHWVEKTELHLRHRDMFGS